MKDKKEKKELKGQSQWDKYQSKKKEKNKEKKESSKLKTEQRKKEGKRKAHEVDTEETVRQKAELELLIGKGHNSTEFKGNTKDRRFEAVLKNKDYAMDPTHREFKKVADGEYIKK